MKSSKVFLDKRDRQRHIVRVNCQRADELPNLHTYELRPIKTGSHHIKVLSLVMKLSDGSAAHVSWRKLLVKSVHICVNAHAPVDVDALPLNRL